VAHKTFWKLLAQELECTFGRAREDRAFRHACNVCYGCNALLGLGGDQPQARLRRPGTVLA
jgi:hypothetical protein